MTTLSPGVNEDYSDWPNSATRFWVAKLAPIKYEKSFVPRVSRRRTFRKSSEPSVFRGIAVSLLQPVIGSNVEIDVVALNWVADVRKQIRFTGRKN